VRVLVFLALPRVPYLLSLSLHDALPISHDGVFVGQPVLDASGLMGQVVEVMPYFSRVLLITDVTHSIPVQVNRNGLRAIASGTRSEEHTSELQSRENRVCRLLPETTHAH